MKNKLCTVVSAFIILYCKSVSALHELTLQMVV